MSLTGAVEQQNANPHRVVQDFVHRDDNAVTTEQTRRIDDSHRNSSGKPREPVSVILPTVDGMDAIGDIANLLEDGDELLVVCDTQSDPVATAEANLPADTQLVVAGPPERCSGKANAVAAGVETATHDRIVLTDDDFAHPESWLNQLRAAYDRVGPASELPVFVGRDALSCLLEPLYACGTIGLYRSNTAWGGALIFDRSDLDERQVCRELRQTVSDDGLLTEHLDITQHWRTRQVRIGGTVRESVERHVRFMQIFRRFEPQGLRTVSTVVMSLSLALVIAPLLGTVVVTALVGWVYAKLRLRRLTFLLSTVTLLLFIPLLLYSLARRTFVWAGRRYRWRGKFETTVVGEQRRR